MAVTAFESSGAGAGAQANGESELHSEFVKIIGDGLDSVGKSSGVRAKVAFVIPGRQKKRIKL